MDSKELINYSKLSELITGRPDVIRKERIMKKYKEPVKELIDLIEYWRTKHNLK